MTKFVITWLIFVVVLDAFLFMGQLAANDINPGRAQFFDTTNSITGQTNIGTNGTYTLNEDVLSGLPQGEGSVSPETGNVFTDLFQSIKGWIADSTGLSYLLTYVNALPNMIKAMTPGAPAFAFIVGSMWHTINFFALVLLVWGRDT